MLSRSIGNSLLPRSLRNAVQLAELQYQRAGASVLCGKEMHSQVDRQGKQRVHSRENWVTFDSMRGLSSNVRTGSAAKGEKSEAGGGAWGSVRKTKLKPLLGVSKSFGQSMAWSP